MQDILDQPAALQRWLDSTYPVDYAAFARLSSGKFRRVIMTGMGSSHHALHSIGLPLSNCTVEVTG